MKFPKKLHNPPVGLIVGACDVTLWGLTGSERARRTLLKTGVGRMASDLTDAQSAQSCLMVRGDWVVDAALVDMLYRSPETVLITRRGDARIVVGGNVSTEKMPALHAAMQTAPGQTAETPANVHVVEHDPAQSTLYLAHLRKRLKPVVMELTAATVCAAEKATFAGSYKSVTDIVTKYVWPAPARVATRWCAKAGITPNMVTLFGFLLVLLTPFAFVKGWFWLGLAGAWVMTFLDTVDGKLARCTMTYTKFGDVFDHGIDLISPPFWWWAWHAGCLAAGAYYPMPTLCLWAVFGGYVILRLQEGLFIQLFGMQIHVWRRFDSFFRLILARRNPILILLTVALALGKPGLGMAAAAVWTLITMAVHLVQTVQALLTRRKGPVRSWMAQ